MAWKVARSLDQLIRQLDGVAPNRKKSHDGNIGDASHQQRKSDHNPDQNGIVRAVDITNDPSGGLSAEALAESLRASQDPRIKYVIWNRRIFSSYSNATRHAWSWGKFAKDPHSHHIHVSINSDSGAESDTSDWALPGSSSRTTATSFTSSSATSSTVSVATLPKIDLKQADASPYRGPGSKQLQGLLLAAGFGPDGLVGDDNMPSGECGELTKQAVGEFQTISGTGRRDGTPDFSIGESTWTALLGSSDSVGLAGGGRSTSDSSTLPSSGGGSVTFTTALEFGSSGPDVVEIQAKLASFGYTVERNGDFGTATKRAVTSFQRSNGEEPNGRVDAKLWQLLGLP